MTADPKGMAMTFFYRRYSRLLIVLVMVPVIATVIGSFFFQPYWGPLTRLGGFLENDYGWNAPQEEFEQPLTKIVWSIKEYDHYYDVVVVGDSFSLDKKKGWQNYFAEATGLSVITLNHNTGVKAVVESKMFQTKPPRFMIFESLESYSLERLASLKTLPPLPPVSDTAYSSTEESPVVPVGRNFVARKMNISVEERADESFNYVEKSIGRFFYKEQPTQKALRAPWAGDKNKFTAYSLPFNDRGLSLFSSKIHDHILIYGLDIGKLSEEPFVNLAAQGAWQMKRSVEANGKTKVLMMLFPDKLTVYAPYLKDPSIAPPSIIPTMAKEYPYQLRLDEVFAKAVASGVQDLYLPDDTHCGYKGYQMAAQQMIQAIEAVEKEASGSTQ